MQYITMTIRRNSSGCVAEIKCPVVIINNIQKLKCKKMVLGTMSLCLCQSTQCEGWSQVRDGKGLEQTGV